METEKTYTLQELLTITGKHRNTILYHRRRNFLNVSTDFYYDYNKKEIMYRQSAVDKINSINETIKKKKQLKKLITK